MGPPHPRQERPRGALALAPTFWALNSSRVCSSTGFSSHLLCPPRWGTFSFFSRRQKMGQFSAVSPQLPSWGAGAGGGADTGHSDELGAWGR